MELNFGQTIWDKTQVLLGTHWEQGGKTKNPSLPTPSKRKKNWTVHECMLRLSIVA
jgi:hypothetical protein